jgi:hypothetical protein
MMTNQFHQKSLFAISTGHMVTAHVFKNDNAANRAGFAVEDFLKIAQNLLVAVEHKATKPAF